MKIILGSSSPWRKKILLEMMSDFEVMSPEIDEKAIRRGDPRELVLAIARAKAEALIEKVHEPALIITADQVVVWNGMVREKPASEAEARYFLRSAHEHPSETVNGVVVSNTATGRQVSGNESSKIFFRAIPEAVIDRLVEIGAVYKCAGGFTSEDELLIDYVDHVEGSMDSVTGLPKKFLEKLLSEAAALGA